MLNRANVRPKFIDRNCNHSQCQSYMDVIDELDKAKKLTKKLDSVLESSYDGIYITDGNGITTMVNKAYERITGLKCEELLNRHVGYLVEKGLISKSCSQIVLETKEITTIQQELLGGKKLLVTGTPIFDMNNDIEMVVINVRDVTELMHLKEALQEKEQKVQLVNKELEALKERLNEKGDVITNSPDMIKILQCSKRVATHDTTILIKGETGAGKEVLVDYIHKNSKRCNEKLIKVNCGAIPENLIESELFGYIKGAFTGANTEGKIGLFEEADHGTVFLDEIGELPFSMQAKLLRVLQEQEVQRVGSTETKKIDVRVIAATNKDLLSMAMNGEFRSDLYYRLSIVPLDIPPLRDRPCDIVPLSDHFLKQLNKKNESNKTFTKEVYDQFYTYSWPGNIRELRNMIERIFVMSALDVIGVESLPSEFYKPYAASLVAEKLSLKDAVMKLEYQMITDAINERGSIRGAAKLLKMDASTLLRKKRKIEENLTN